MTVKTSREEWIEEIRKTLTTLKRQAEGLDNSVHRDPLSPTHAAAQMIFMRVDDTREELTEAMKEGW